MPPTNDFLPFCPTDTGTNLLSEADYTASGDRVSGNKPGVASAKLNNRALRQANAIASQVAQLIANVTGTNVLDDGDMTKLIGQMSGALTVYPPVLTKYTSGSGNHNITYIFQITSGNATIGATYTNNGITYTITGTIAAATVLRASGNGAPTASGTLTKASGTGDATLTFHAVRAPVSLNVRMVGGGGGGGGQGTSGGSAGGTGGNTTFGTALLVANGGTGGGVGAAGAGTPGAGGTASLGTGPFGVAQTGSKGGGGMGSAIGTVSLVGGKGGDAPYFGGGAPSILDGAQAATTNSGGGGSGAGNVSSGLAANTGGGGGSGGFVDALITTVLSTYAYVVGAAGTVGGAGASGFAGGLGGSGIIIVTENYQ